MKNLKLSLISFLLFTVTSLLLLGGCEVKKNATGMEDMIYVVADSGEYKAMQDELEQVFGKVIYTPQPENLFRLQRVPLNNLSFAMEMKNVIIMAPLNSGSQTSKYLNTILDSTVKEMIGSKQDFAINKRDLWSKNQLVMILTSPTIEQLKSDLLFDADNLLYQFQEASSERLLKGLYRASFEQQDIEGKLLNDYGWIVYVQTDFVLAKEAPDENFVWLRSPPGKDMERWLFVHWVENATPAMLNNQYIYDNRNRITENFYRTSDDSAYVEIAYDYLNTKEVNFNDKYALMTQGLWRMTDGSMGGPFTNYTFFDEKTERLYMIDASIFAPKYKKKKLIQQMDIILRSFRTDADLSPERIRELLSSVE